MYWTIYNYTNFPIYINSIHHPIESSRKEKISVNVFDTKLILSDYGFIEMVNEYNEFHISKISEEFAIQTKQISDSELEIRIFNKE